ncbi:unnamed protein product [Alternaria alternata]
MTDETLPTRQLKQTSQDKQNVYERHALRPNSNTIRVLDVQPIPKDAIEGTPVNCTLRVIHLDRDPDFTALSYVWGDPEHKRSIVCDGVLFPVTENCYSALWNLTLLVGVVGTCSTEIPELGIKFRFDYSTELVYMMLTVGAIPGTVFYAWMEVRDFFNPFRRDLDDTGSDTLVGALYQRAATNSRDMAYGIWAILPKIGASVLPKPAYDADDGTQIPLVYWQLTVSLLQVTGNSRILFIAATRRMQNTPSWVPDWSTFKSNAWRDLPGFPGTDFLRGHPRISPETKEMVKKERAHQRVSIDPTQRILSVLAEDTGAICGCVSFQSTSKTFEALERNSHLQNMRSMLQRASWAENIGCKVSGFFFPPSNHELALEVTPLSAGATSPGWRDRTQWEKLLRKPRRDKLNIYLTRWMDGVKVPRWFLRFMSTQIYLCTLFAELKRKICYVSISDEPGKFRLLVCSAETQVNDRLIRLCGLPSPMVMRKHGELANSVSIISPTALQGQGARRKSKSRNEGSEISLENQFVKYHIH